MELADPPSDGVCLALEAAVRVTTVLAGVLDRENVAVRFDDSVDIAHVREPKLKAGQEGILLCRRTTSPDRLEAPSS
jgi:hypothetical protein